MIWALCRPRRTGPKLRMAASSTRHIIKLLIAPIAGACVAFAPSSGFAAVMPFLDDPPRALIAETALEVRKAIAVAQAHATATMLAKEQAMSTAELIDRWTPYIKEASHRFKISTDWIKAVIRVESGGRTLSDNSQLITSSAGAMGIMQVMPETYRDMRNQYGLGKNPHDPRDNILAGTAYLSQLKEKYGYPKMFAAYNAGPATLDAQSAGTRKLPKETRDYVKRISTILGIDHFTASPARPAKVVATLTRPGGSTITIDGGTVDKIRAAFPNEFVPGVKTVVIMGQRMQGVLEDVSTVAALLRPRVSAQYLPGV